MRPAPLPLYIVSIPFMFQKLQFGMARPWHDDGVCPMRWDDGMLIGFVHRVALSFVSKSNFVKGIEIFNWEASENNRLTSNVRSNSVSGNKDNNTEMRPDVKRGRWVVSWGLLLLCC